MKAMKLKKTVSFLLSIVMVFGMAYIASPYTYAATTRPIIEGIDADSCTISWDSGVIESFSSKIVKVDFYNEEDDSLLVNFDTTGSGSRRSQHYDGAGTITVYVDKLPGDSDLTDVDSNPQASISLATQSKTATQQVFNFITVLKNNGYCDYDNTDKVTLKNRGYLTSGTTKRNYYYYTTTLKAITELCDGFSLVCTSAERNGATEAMIEFVSPEEGTYYYLLSDSKLENPEINTSGTGYSMGIGINSFSVSNLSGYGAKYVYVVGTNATESTPVLEIVIPSVKFKIKHETQALEGMYMQTDPISGDFYTESFTNQDGIEIDEAEPGDTVFVTFKANGGTIQPNVITNGDTIENDKYAYKFSRWDIQPELDVQPSGTTFSFVMPESDVTIQAIVVPAGGDVKFVSSMEAPLYIGYQYYSTDYDVWLIDWALYQGETSHEFKFKYGFKIRMDEYYKPGQSINDSTVFDQLVIKHNGSIIDLADEVVYGTGFEIAEGEDYEFGFVFREKAFAFITTAANDSSMGTASASVNSTTLVYEGDTVTLTASPNEGYVLKEWQVKDDNGTTIPVTVDSEDPNKASFVMTADYSDEITATAVFEAEGQEEGEARIQEVTASFDGMIRLNYYVSIPEGYADATNSVKAVFTLNGKTTTINASDAVYVAAKNGYKFSISVLAAEVSDTVNIKFVDKNDAPFTLMNKSGTTDFTETGANFSVLQYMNMIAGNGGLEAELDNAAKDYCNAVKNRFLGTSIELRSVVAAVTENDLKDYAATMTGTLPSGISFKEMTVMFESDNSFRFYFNFNGVDPHSTDYTYTIDGKPAEIKQSAKGYYLVVPSIAAAELDNEHTIVVSDGTSTCTMKASALSYARAMIRSNASEADKLMCKALYLYNQAANAFFD